MNTTKGIKTVSDFAISILDALICIMKNKFHIDPEFSNPNFIKSLCICLKFGSKRIYLYSLMCLCIIFGKNKDSEYKGDLFDIILSMWKKIIGNNECIVLWLSVLSYCCNTAENVKSLEVIENLISTLIELINNNTTSLDTEFYMTYCQIPMMNLLKFLLKFSAFNCCEYDILSVIELALYSDYEEIRTIALEILGIYVADSNSKSNPGYVVLYAIAKMLKSNDTKIIIKTLKCLGEILKNSNYNSSVIKSGCFFSLLKIMVDGNVNTIYLASSIVFQLINIKEAMEIFFKCNGVVFALLTIVHFII